MRFPPPVLRPCLRAESLRRLWDGLLSGSDRILVLGATNRIQDIDPAFLRRMPKRFSVPLPDARQREKILRLVRLPHSSQRSPLTEAVTRACA